MDRGTHLARLCKEHREHWEFPQALPQATLGVVGQGKQSEVRGLIACRAAAILLQNFHGCDRA